jgi:hypothetical protein
MKQFILLFTSCISFTISALAYEDKISSQSFHQVDCTLHKRIQGQTLAMVAGSFTLKLFEPTQIFTSQQGFNEPTDISVELTAYKTPAASSVIVSMTLINLLDVNAAKVSMTQPNGKALFATIQRPGKNPYQPVSFDVLCQ